jgi:hypothetical protein
LTQSSCGWTSLLVQREKIEKQNKKQKTHWAAGQTTIKNLSYFSLKSNAWMGFNDNRVYNVFSTNTNNEDPIGLPLSSIILDNGSPIGSSVVFLVPRLKTIGLAARPWQIEAIVGLPLSYTKFPDCYIVHIAWPVPLAQVLPCP